MMLKMSKKKKRMKTSVAGKNGAKGREDECRRMFVTPLNAEFLIAPRFFFLFCLRLCMLIVDT